MSAASPFDGALEQALDLATQPWAWTTAALADQLPSLGLVVDPESSLDDEAAVLRRLGVEPVAGTVFAIQPGGRITSLSVILAPGDAAATQATADKARSVLTKRFGAPRREGDAVCWLTGAGEGALVLALRTTARSTKLTLTHVTNQRRFDEGA